MVGKMYPSRKTNIAVWRGCSHDCAYCAFRHSLARSGCERCRAYIPHYHPESYGPPPRTGPGEFVSIGMNGDVCFASDEEFDKLVLYCRHYNSIGSTTFFMQSKNPAVFQRYEERWGDWGQFPPNLILGTTIETNRDTTAYSKAPPPIKRAQAMVALHHTRRAVTIEPVMDFDTEEFVALIKAIKPERVWVGYNSRPERCRLPEPSLDKTLALVQALRRFTTVELKLIREATDAPAPGGRTEGE